jgi:diguanylate cyclase (GGDEF)-like protein
MTATYNYWLVFVSLVVAILASYTTFDLVTRITLSKGLAAKAWLLVGAWSMGLGIWSMHFVGMLAFHLPIPMAYDVPVTLLSMAIAITMSGLALYIVSRDTSSAHNAGLGALTLGLGMCAMHYTAMAAMQAHPAVTYDPALFAASIVIAVAAAFAALRIAFTPREPSTFSPYGKLGGAFVMGCAIAGTHYTAMAAAQFAPDTICLTGPLVDNSWLAGTLSASTSAILCITLGLSIVDTRVASKTAAIAASLKRANDELQKLALHDPLTKLPNRSLLEDRIQQAIVHAGRGKLRSAVLFLDLDRFKVVNDSLGHVVGDELLRAVGARLETLVRAEDTVSRLGGDEFVILLREVANVEDAANIASKILEALRERFRVHEQELYVTPSIGISVYPLHGDTAQMLIARADAAMYSAKQAGRNAFQVFTPDMVSFFPERIVLENELRRGIACGEFELYYQPKARFTDGTIVGVEALVRWRHPQRGLLPPLDFVPLAEESGLITALGSWVIERACAQNKAWRDAGLPHLRVAVNVSAAQFREEALLDTIRDALHDSGLPAECLELEITEGIVMRDPSEAVVTLEKLSEIGVQVALDDFGTGCSRLTYLKRFAIDRLKIDRSLIRDLPSDSDDAAIVKATIELAHSLRLKVVAEGVESAEQLEFLRALGCDEYQGYYKSCPLTARQFESSMRSGIEASAGGAAVASLPR